VEREIFETTASLVTALERGDAAAAGNVYSDDARLLAPSTELIQGRAAIEEYWRAGIALGLSAVRFESQLLESVGASVVEIGRYRVSVEVERAEPAVDRGTHLVLHRQTADGCWQRALDVFDPDEPSGSSHHPEGGESNERT